MKLRHLIALCGILFSALSSSIAQPSPFDVSLTNLDWSHFPIFLTPELQTNRAIFGDSQLVVYFDSDFTVRAKAQMDELFPRGHIARHRLVRIVDGGHVVTEGKLVGRSEKSDGLILAFASVEGAKQAATAIRQSITDGHLDELIRRHNPNL